MFGFIAEYMGKGTAYIVDLGEAIVDDTVSTWDKFSEGYESIRPNAPEEPTETEVK